MKQISIVLRVYVSENGAPEECCAEMPIDTTALTYSLRIDGGHRGQVDADELISHLVLHHIFEMQRGIADGLEGARYSLMHVYAQQMRDRLADYKERKEELLKLARDYADARLAPLTSFAPLPVPSENDNPK